MRRIITAEECFHFSEVGSGKTKVILPLLCQTFLSTNAEARHHLAGGGPPKHVLIVLVPEHLMVDARTQAVPAAGRLFASPACSLLHRPCCSLTPSIPFVSAPSAPERPTH